MSWIQNKRVVVTGTTSGIGRKVATALAARGAEVVLACRDGARAEAVAHDIATSTSCPAPQVLTVDTSDGRSIRAFADRYADHHDRLDVLVNNAGVLLPGRAVNAAGVELTFATNVLGYYLVATELCSTLPAPPSRIINVASTFAFALDLDDLQFHRRPYDGMSAYAQSKACDRLLTWALARRLKPQGVAVNATAPGLVLETSLYRALTADARRDLEQYGPRPVDDGGDTTVWLASSDDVADVTGRFFERRAEIPCEFRNEEDEERLWRACEHHTSASVPSANEMPRRSRTATPT
ncbi:MAG: SDR family NAD(P)-dependent oxidoreductase [Chloroflexota bacterium]|nr:SDR family NAD(P)-dependent oxidoreductase [Chloroflexota bacterium]